jgi:hypothetical protein
MSNSRHSDPAERRSCRWQCRHLARTDASVRLVAVPTEQRAPILREYVRIAPGGRWRRGVRPS